MTEHTPGPWRTVQEADYEPPEMSVCMIVENAVPDRDETAIHIAFAFGCTEQAQADARLIAAAPELLAACETAIHALRLSESCQDEINDATDLIRAAIAKARGEKE